MTLARKTGEVKYVAAGPMVYPAGKYDPAVTYTRTALVVPMVLCDTLYYVLNKKGSFKGINPKTDYATNKAKATWVMMDQMKYAFVEVLMANFAKLASAVFHGNFMFSQQGTNAAGAATNDYTKFGTDAFTPNLMLDFLTGLFKCKNVDIEGTITANAAFIKMHSFRADEGYFYLNPDYGSEFINGRPVRISQSRYMLPDSGKYAGMKISLTIYKDLSSTSGYISVVTRDAFNETELVGSDMKYCNKANIPGAGRYEFISLGNMWVLANSNGASLSYASLDNQIYEDPIK